MSCAFYTCRLLCEHSCLDALITSPYNVELWWLFVKRRHSPPLFEAIFEHSYSIQRTKWAENIHTNNRALMTLQCWNTAVTGARRAVTVAHQSVTTAALQKLWRDVHDARSADSQTHYTRCNPASVSADTEHHHHHCHCYNLRSRGRGLTRSIIPSEYMRKNVVNRMLYSDILIPIPPGLNFAVLFLCFLNF